MLRSILALRLAASAVSFAPRAALRRRLQISPLQAQDGPEVEAMAVPGVQSFRDLRELGAVVVDKTEFAWKIPSNPGRSWMFIRPRRQGKTLMLDTVAELFGSDAAELFEGTAIEDRVKSPAWQARPVIRMNFGGEKLVDKTVESNEGIPEPGEMRKKDAQIKSISMKVTKLLVERLRTNAERLGVMDEVFVEDAMRRDAAAVERAEAADRLAKEADQELRFSRGRVEELNAEKERLEETCGSEAEMAAIQAEIRAATTIADENAARARRASDAAQDAGDAAVAAAAAAAAAGRALAAATGTTTSGSPRLETPGPSELLRRLLAAAAEQHKASMQKRGDPVEKGGVVAVLIDEYDLPSISVLDANGGLMDAKVEAVGDTLKPFFTALKGDPNIFTQLIVGATRFAVHEALTGTSIKDVTGDEAFATVTGFTQKEIKDTYPKRLKAWATRHFAGDDDAMWTWLTKNYGGIRYCEVGGVQVEPLYNTWDVVNCLSGLDKHLFWGGHVMPAWLSKAATRGVLALPRSAGVLTERRGALSEKDRHVSDLFGKDKRRLVNVVLSAAMYEQDAACWALRQAGIFTIREVVRNADSKYDLTVGVPNNGCRELLARLITNVGGVEDMDVLRRVREAAREGQVAMLLEAICENIGKEESWINTLSKSTTQTHEPSMTVVLGVIANVAFLVELDGGACLTEYPLRSAGNIGSPRRIDLLVSSGDMVMILEAKTVERRDDRPDGATLKKILGRKKYRKAVQQTRGYHSALSTMATDAISTGRTTEVRWSASSQIGAFLFVLEHRTGRLVGVETVEEFARDSAET